jgi:hypothetical protein
MRTRREPAVLLGRRRRVHRIVLGHHARVIDLEDEARVDDRPVLRLHRVGERPEVLLFRPVVVIGTLQLDRSGRDGGDEGFLEALPLQRRLEVGDVGLDRGGAAVRDGAGAHRVRHRRRTALRAALDLAVGVGEPPAVAAPGRAAATAGQIVASLEAGETIGDVLGKARFRVLAVARDVDPALGLHPHRPGHKTGQGRTFAIAERRAVRLSPEDLDQLRRPDEAPDVRGEDAARAPLHR